jgi:hypothetical protein
LPENDKIAEQVKKAGLPTTGTHPFEPRLTRNKRREQIIEKRAVTKGPKRGKRGYVDVQDRIWVKDRAHAGVPDHWDVQIDEARTTCASISMATKLPDVSGRGRSS